MPPVTHHQPTQSPEFPPGASEWPDHLDRRRFLEISGAALALAGLSTAGCGRREPEAAVARSEQREFRPLGESRYYATAHSWRGYARGVIAESMEGRPVKLEGNPSHPSSLGAIDAIGQSSLLDLYDPDRRKAPLKGGRIADWRTFEDELRTLLNDGVGQGEGVWVMVEPTTSPTFLRLVQEVSLRYPALRWVLHDPFENYGHPAIDFRFDRADIILGLGADFLTEHPESLRYAREFARRRRTSEDGRVMNRFYQVESMPSLTGSMADYRLPLEAAKWGDFLAAVEANLDGNKVSDTRLSLAARAFAASVAEDLRAHQGSSLALAGASASAALRERIAALNERLGSVGPSGPAVPVPVVRSDALMTSAARPEDLILSLQKGEVGLLLILNGNPAWAGRQWRQYSTSIPMARMAVSLGVMPTETGNLCHWNLPAKHYLESWHDLRAFTGPASVVQPLMEPLYGGRSELELLELLASGRHTDDLELVRETWRDKLKGESFDAAWKLSLRDGVIQEAEPISASLSSSLEASTNQMPGSAGLSLEAPVRGDTLSTAPMTLHLLPDLFLRGGEYANNAWLQELPRPETTITWGNALWISHELAEDHLKDGDMVVIHTPAGRAEVPVVRVPGMAERTLVLHLGHGRETCGRVGEGVGVNAWPLLPEEGNGFDVSVTQMEATGRHVALAQVQHHHEMEEPRPIRIRQVTGEAADGPGEALPGPEKRNDFAPGEYSKAAGSPYAWGMSIDLNTCIGCSACVAACQAENNIPSVGREQVIAGREMHWIRLHRYFVGDEPARAREVHQPVPCMQCEAAPCELVCPTGATQHSSDGLNDMVYNRCIGTRYCSNNCPYRVRRFNFLEYRRPLNDSRNLQHNPEVTIRERGVMEKCTYCVQRITRARIEADKEGRLIRDGEVVTACQQACPAEAIVFGNLKDPESRVVQRKALPGDYSLLEELGTRPRTTYLPKWINDKSHHEQ